MDLLSNTTNTESVEINPESIFAAMESLQREVDRINQQRIENLEWRLMPMYGMKIVEQPKCIFGSNFSA